MVIYWSMLLWVFFIGLVQPNEHNPLLNNHAVGYKVSWKLAIALMLPVTFFAAVRSGVLDTATYIGMFKSMPEYAAVFDEWIRTQKDSQLFYGLSDLWKCYVSDDPQWWLALIAVLHGVCLTVAFRKHSVNMPMTAYLFIASTAFSWMYNGIRQFLVITILFALTDCIIKNRWYIYVPVLLFISGIEPILEMANVETPWWLCGVHQSGLLMLPVFFFVQGKAYNWKMLLMTFVFCLLAITGALEPLLGTAMETVDRVDEFAMLAEAGDNGAHPIRAVVASAPLVLALLKKKEIDTMGDNVPALVHISINMTIFTVALYVASTLTGSGIMIGRLPAYTELYSYLLIPWLLTNIYKKDQMAMTYCVYGAYLLWFLYQMLIAWGGLSYLSDILGLYYW